jgi:hypothetical protein
MEQDPWPRPKRIPGATISDVQIKPDPTHDALVIECKLTLTVPDKDGLEAALALIAGISRLRGLGAGETT